MAKKTSINDDKKATTTYNFSIDGIKIQFEQGPDIDMSKISKELISNIFGVTSKIFDAAGNIISAAGDIVSTSGNNI
jgi:hypothetical protein